MVLPSTRGETQKLPLTTWLSSWRTSHSASGVGAPHCPALTPATYRPVCSSACSWTLGKSTAISAMHLRAVSRCDGPHAGRQHDRHDGQRHVHGLEAERVLGVADDVLREDEPDEQRPADGHAQPQPVARGHVPTLAPGRVEHRNDALTK